MKAVASALIAVGLCGCATVGGVGLPKTQGELASNYGYVPLDPLAVTINSKCSNPAPILDALPDIAVRFAVASIDESGGLNFGPSKTTVKNSTYRAVLDYVNVDVVPVDFKIRKMVGPKHSVKGNWVPVSSPLEDGFEVLSYDAQYIPPNTPGYQIALDDGFERITIPVYVGIGLRLTADIRALQGDIALSGLGAIGAQAEAKNLSGTMTVQTLGVTGKAIAVALPLPSKLDQSTIEAGILAIGGSRALIYTSATADEKTTAQVRIVGLYSPIGSDPRLINSIYSELSRERPPWNRPCSGENPLRAPVQPLQASETPPPPKAP